MLDNNKVISWLRTVVPGAWGIFLAWVVGYVALPDQLVTYLTSPAALVLVTALAIGVWKGVFNWLEPRMPDWLTRILLGSSQTPAYGVDGAVDGSEPDQEEINGETFNEDPEIEAPVEEDPTLPEVDGIAAPWLRGE